MMASRETRWFFWRSGAGEAAANMAWDETLLEVSRALGSPLFRSYGWTEPAASFGYFQKHAEIERATSLRPLVRRPTGGGLVPHDHDWTYSVIIPPSDPWYSDSAVSSYRRIHEWLRLAFAEIDVATELSTCSRTDLPGQCFAGAEQFDLLFQNRKIAGAAQRRNRSGLLIQGSVQPPRNAPNRSEWEDAMRKVAKVHHGVQWIEWEPDATVQVRAEELAISKYARADFNEKK